MNVERFYSRLIAEEFRAKKKLPEAALNFKLEN